VLGEGNGESLPVHACIDFIRNENISLTLSEEILWLKLK